MLKRFIVGAAMAVAMLAQTAVPPKAAKPAVAAAKAVKSTAPELNKPVLAAYLRRVLMWPATVAITLGEPAPAPMPGFYKLKVHGAVGERSQDEYFYVSTDNQTVLRGDVFDLNKSPFQPEIDLLKTEGQPFLGTPGAPVTVVEFSDFQCPYCKEEAAIVRAKLMEAFPKDVQLYFMDYPLNAIHPFARGAAIMGRCIYHQNNASFWAYHDWIFEHQTEVTPENLKDKVLEFAKTDKNLDSAKLTACAVSNEVRDEVDRSVALGDKLRINATPTLFINGRRMVGTIPIADLQTVVNDELGYAKTAMAAKKDADCCSVQLSLPGMGSGKSASPTGKGVVAK